MQGDLYSGRYNRDEIQRILEINARPTMLQKPEQAYYKKNALENGPTWKEKREFVHWLINDSNVSASSKMYLRENQYWLEKYQLRGLKYGLFTSAATYLFFPVIRRQPFVRRFAISMLPMAYFMNWGYVWGHENWWRRQKEVIVTYEIFSGNRHRTTMK